MVGVSSFTWRNGKEIAKLIVLFHTCSSDVVYQKSKDVNGDSRKNRQEAGVHHTCVIDDVLRLFFS